MRTVHAFIALAGLAAAASSTPATDAVACSVFDRHPCNPTVCGVRRGPCMPEFDPPIGQDLRVTIESTGTPAGQGPTHDDGQPDDPHSIDTIRALFDKLRGCWVPPSPEQARHGMQMSVRLSFKRSGEIIGTPRLTYATPDSSPDVRDIYRHAIDAALDRCTPMPFGKGMGGAIAGRPIAIRFVDNREPPQ
jgi:hypothetical protein